MGYKVGDLVLSSEHKKAIGEVLRVNKDDALTIQWTTPRSETLPFGHQIIEFWPVEDQHLLIPFFEEV